MLVIQTTLHCYAQLVPRFTGSSWLLHSTPALRFLLLPPTAPLSFSTLIHSLFSHTKINPQQLNAMHPTESHGTKFVFDNDDNNTHHHHNTTRLMRRSEESRDWDSEVLENPTKTCKSSTKHFSFIHYTQSEIPGKVSRCILQYDHDPLVSTNLMPL